MALSGVSFMRNICKYAPLIGKRPLIRCISTSKKNRDTATVTSEVQDKAACEVDTQKNWMSYGFSHTDYEEDRHFTHAIMFLAVTVIFCGGGFIFMYRPDDIGRDWAQREAFLELRRREANGLPLIDPNYIPESKIILPSDEELGDTEIII